MLETYGGKSSIAFVFTLVIYHAHQPNRAFFLIVGMNTSFKFIVRQTTQSILLILVSRLFLYTCVYFHLSMRESPRDL